jgi:hypothetical protein
LAKIIRELILEFYERFEAKKALNENILERILRGKKKNYARRATLLTALLISTWK